MKDIMSRSQQKILSLLSDGRKYTYEKIASKTGLSYDGVRGRISELISKGVNIQRLREGRNSVVMLEEDSPRTFEKHVTYSDAISKRIQSINDFNDMIDFLSEIREKKIFRKNKKTEIVDSEEAAVLLLSDLHFGEIIKNEYGEIVFNTEEAETRLEYLFDNVREILIGRSIKTLRILMLGDIVDGDTIYRNHLFRIEKAAIDQVKDAVRAIASNMREVLNAGIDIRVDAVRGNHGITNYKNLEEDNWDNVVYDMLDLVFSDEERVEFNHFQTDQAKIPILDRNIVIYHGELMGNQIKTASGLKTFRGMCGKHKLKENDIICVGHLHEFGVESDQGKYLIRNGALPDASEFALKFNYFSEPEQTLLVIGEGIPYPVIIPIEVKY